MSKGEHWEDEYVLINADDVPPADVILAENLPNNTEAAAQEGQEPNLPAPSRKRGVRPPCVLSFQTYCLF